MKGKTSKQHLGVLLQFVANGYDTIPVIMNLPDQVFTDFEKEQEVEELTKLFSVKNNKKPSEEYANILTEEEMEFIGDLQDYSPKELLSILKNEYIPQLTQNKDLIEDYKKVLSTLKRVIQKISALSRRVDEYNVSYHKRLKAFIRENKTPGKVVFLSWLANNLNNREALLNKANSLINGLVVLNK